MAKLVNSVVAITGSSGLIGSALAATLRASDHRARIVRRTPANPDELHWKPETGEFDSDAPTDVDAVVNPLRAIGLRYATVDRRRTLDPRPQWRALRLAEVFESRPEVLAHHVETG